MSFSRRVLVGVGLGIVTGLFLGELASPFEVVADAYVRLLGTTRGYGT